MVSKCLNVSPLWEPERCMKDADQRAPHAAVDSKGPRKKGSDVQNVRTTHFNFFFTTFFTRSSAHRIVSSRLATTARTKVTVKKTPTRAGATPLLGGQSAQNVVGSLPPAPSSSGPCFGRV